MKSGRASVKKLLYKLGKRCTGSPLLGECSDLLLGGNLTGDEEPEKRLRQGLGATRSLGEQLLALRDGLATEADALLCDKLVESQGVADEPRTGVKD